MASTNILINNLVKQDIIPIKIITQVLLNTIRNLIIKDILITKGNSFIEWVYLIIEADIQIDIKTQVIINIKVSLKELDSLEKNKIN